MCICVLGSRQQIGGKLAGKVGWLAVWLGCVCADTAAFPAPLAPACPACDPFPASLFAYVATSSALTSPPPPSRDPQVFIVVADSVMKQLDGLKVGGQQRGRMSRRCECGWVCIRMLANASVTVTCTSKARPWLTQIDAHLPGGALPVLADVYGRVLGHPPLHARRAGAGGPRGYVRVARVLSLMPGVQHPTP